MSEFNQLREAILQQVHARGERRLRQATKMAEIERERSQAALLQERALKREQQMAQLRQTYARQKQQIAYQLRQATLTAKQDILKALFDGAERTLYQWDESMLLPFLRQVLQQFADQSAVLTFGETTRHQLSEATFAQLAQEFPQLTVSSDIIRQEGGFVVTVGKVDYNYLFSELVQAIYQEESYQIANQLFNA